VRLNVGPNEWRNLMLAGIDDFKDIRIGQMTHLSGPWPPEDKQLLIERSALSAQLGVPMAVGQTLRIETADQTERMIDLVGVVHDLNVAPTFIFNTYYGYINLDTIEWLGESRDFNSMSVRVIDERYFDPDFVRQVATDVRNKIERSGREVEEIFIPPEPGKSPIQSFGLDPILFILSTLGVLSVFMSGFLVTNTLTGLLAQQMKQIGIMKSIGARNQHIMGMYLVLVLAFGVLALMIGMPLAYLAAGGFTTFFAGLFNFDARTYGAIPSVVGLQLFVGLLIPVLAAIQPILKGTGITIREALSTSSGPGSYGDGFIDTLLIRIRGIPRPLMLSLRNTFRRKSRLILTLVTLTLGGATFIGVFSVQESVRVSLDELFAQLVRYDLTVSFEETYRTDRLLDVAYQVPGVAVAESWGSITARRLRPDDSESEVIQMLAPPSDTQMVQPEIVDGRWLLPDDENAVTVSLGVIDDEPDIQVGDTITLKFKGRETDWTVVGTFKSMDNTELIAYANNNYFAREVREAGVSERLTIVTEYDQFDRENQERMLQTVEQAFREAGIKVSSSDTAVRLYDQSISNFNIIIYCLLIMAMLVALVGGIGLMGTMSMNVLERTREIGVMRAIGASDGSVLSIMIVEGIIIGCMSWLLGVLLALPISKLLSDGVGYLFLGTPLTYSYSLFWAIVWLFISILLSAIASFLPAWNASRLTVRDVLSYE
ncbi:MAG: FtsX-like permease family protein, partial [Chloroflexaceae bacterium]|nr:FtsX-like permease family protein [Chloroflexaceae bacterium]